MLSRLHVIDFKSLGSILLCSAGRLFHKFSSFEEWFFFPRTRCQTPTSWNVPFFTCFVIHPNLCILWSLFSSVYPHSPPYTLPMHFFFYAAWKSRLILCDSILPFYHLLVLSLSLFFVQVKCMEKMVHPQNRNYISSCYPAQGCSYERQWVRIQVIENHGGI